MHDLVNNCSESNGNSMEFKMGNQKETCLSYFSVLFAIKSKKRLPCKFVKKLSNAYNVEILKLYDSELEFVCWISLPIVSSRVKTVYLAEKDKTFVKLTEIINQRQKIIERNNLL